jgi:glycosyltransferase involved in cell wall biosynthesis
VKLLFLTQRLDGRDAVLGFVPRWVEGLARECERVRVVALDARADEPLPENVDVRVVGRRGRLRRWLRYRRILREAFAEGFDAVLAHMVPRYALVAAGPARAAGARLFLWYTHGSVDRRLERAVALAQRVFTANAESLRIDTPKRCVTGHGIDLDHFDAAGRDPEQPPRLLVVGRVTPRKDPLTAVGALERLVAEGRDVHLDLVGDALAPGDAEYVARVRAAVRSAGLDERVAWHGAVPYAEVGELYRRASVLLHPSRTGSIDKVVLEAMAAGRPFATCNDSFPPLLAELGDDAARLQFPAGDAAALAARAAAWLDAPDTAEVGARLRAIVARDHEVDALMARLVREMGASA